MFEIVPSEGQRCNSVHCFDREKREEDNGRKWTMKDEDTKKIVPSWIFTRSFPQVWTHSNIKYSSLERLNLF